MMHVSSAADAVRHINAGAKPLALYVFSKDSATARFIIDNTSSGSAMVNDVMVFAAGMFILQF